MLKKIISGCQMGADIAGIDAAIANGFPYGGWVPKGRKTEIGPLPLCYKVQEMPTPGYPKRTEKNVIESDGTVIFTHGPLSGGSDLTRKYAEKHGKPCLHMNMLEQTVSDAVKNLHQWIQVNNIEVVNIAGKSASKDEKIYSMTMSVIDDLSKLCTFAK